MENTIDKYKEILSKVKPLYERAKKENCPIWSTYEYLFPELAESEDERIRKAIFKALSKKDAREVLKECGVEVSEALAWLEKQKECISNIDAICLSAEIQKPYKDGNQWCILKGDNIQEGVAGFGNTQEDALVDLIRNVSIEKQKEQNLDIELIQRSWYMEGYHDRKFGKEPKWIIKTGDGGPKYEENPKYGQPLEEEQKPAEWSEDCREEDLRTRFAFYTYKDEDSVLYLSNVFVEEASRNKGFGTKILAAAEKVAETLGAISIRLKVKQNSPANTWYRKHGYGYMAFEGDYDWLEKTLEYLKPKQEWNEEDEKKVREIYDLLVNVCNAEIKFPKLLSWLKSLRPQHYWKPSEEQMNALKLIVSNKKHYAPVLHEIALDTLYNDLKKL